MLIVRCLAGDRICLRGKPVMYAFFVFLFVFAYSRVCFFRNPVVALVWCIVSFFCIVLCCVFCIVLSWNSVLRCFVSGVVFCFFVVVIYYNVYVSCVLCVRFFYLCAVIFFLWFFYSCDMFGFHVVVYVFLFFMYCCLVKKVVWMFGCEKSLHYFCTRFRERTGLGPGSSSVKREFNE